MADGSHPRPPARAEAITNLNNVAAKAGVVLMPCLTVWVAPVPWKIVTLTSMLQVHCQFC